MNFLNPLVLFGLAAASIPIVLHLLNLRKLKKIDFSTLAFLKELQRTRIRKLKVTQILLLILRTLAVIFIVLAFARPTIPTSLPGLATRAKTSAVILLDNSFSMELSDERGSRFKQAKEAAQGILQSLSDGDEVALVVMGDLDDKRYFEFTRNFSMLGEDLGKVSVSYTSAHLYDALRRASAILSNSKNLNKEVFVISDAQKNLTESATRSAADSLRLFDKSTVVYSVPIGVKSKQGERNLAVDSLSVLTSVFEAGKDVEVSARVRNGSNEAVNDVVVSLVMNNDRIAQRTVSIPAKESRTISLSGVPRAQSGAVQARVEIDADVLDADNRRYFGFVIPDRPSIALVGSPQETNFLALALMAQSNTVTRFTYEQFLSANISTFGVIYFAGISSFSQSEATRLANYVQNGGGLLIFPGQNSDIQSYNKVLLPTLGFASIAEKTYSTPTEFTSSDKSHPIFSGIFKGTTDGKAKIESPQIRKAFIMNGRGILDVADGAFMAESRLGNGKVLYFAVPPTNEWSSFAMTGLFASLAHKSAGYLSATETPTEQRIVGEPITLVLPKQFSSGGSFTILDPDGTSSVRQSAVLPSGSVISLESVRKPGMYIVQTPNGKPIQTIAVNPPASESIIAAFTEKEMESILAQTTPSADHVRTVENTRSTDFTAVRSASGAELWKLFVVLAIVCALAEMIVARSAMRAATSAA